MTRSTIQQTHMENGDLKSRVKVEEHQDGFINHSNLDRFVYQNGVRNQSQQTSMKLTHDGDNKLNRRSSILSVDDIQCLQRIGQVIKRRTFSADPLSQARTSCFVGPKQEPVDGVAMEGPGVQDLFGAGSNDVNHSFSSGLINSVPLPAQMPRVPPGSCNSFPSRMPHNVCWEPPYYNSATDWGTSGESVLAQPSTATFHKSGYLPIAGLVTPISAPLPQIQSQHEPLFTNTQVNGADPQTEPGSWLTLLMAMASQWGSPSPPTEANTSPYITPDVVSEMPSSSPRTPVRATFNDRASRSLTMQQHSGPVTAVDFSEAPMPPGTYFPNNVSAIEASSPHTTIASAEPVHEAVPGLQLTPTASHFPFQNSSPQFRIPMPLPPSLQNVTPASLHAAASGSNWTRACPIVPKLEISSPQDLSTTPGAAGLNALPTASLIKSESVQPPFLPQPSAVSSNFNTLFPQVSHMGRLQFPRKRSPMMKELSEPAAVAWNHIQGGVRAINLDSKDKQKRMGAGGQTVTVEGDDTQHQQRRQRQEVGINQRKKWKLCRRFGMIHPDNEELIKSAGRQAKVIVANNQVDKEWRKLLQRRYWQLGDVCKNADSEGNVEQKRRWMLVRTRLLQSLILWKKARYRARLLTHPLFPHLLKAHVDCIRVMTPACKSLVITMQLQGAQRFFEKFLRFAPICPDEDKRRLDVHLETFLLQMKKFQDHLESQLKFHAIPTYSRLWRIEQALFQMTGTRIPRGLESGPTMTEELEEGGSGVDSANIIRAATARVDYANIKRVIDARYCGAHKPTAPDRAIMETIRAEIVDSIGLAHYRRKIREVREEIMKKRSASKLPEGTTEILKEWWEAHSKRPYPTEHEKELLVKQTGLELKQVNNWFINQRKRNWHDNPLATNNRDKRKYPQAERKQA